MQPPSVPPCPIALALRRTGRQAVCRRHVVLRRAAAADSKQKAAWRASATAVAASEAVSRMIAGFGKSGGMEDYEGH